MALKTKKRKLFGPVIVLCILTLLIMIASLVFSLMGIEGEKVAIINGTLETSLTTVKNIFSVDGIRYVIGNAVTNFRLLEPLVLLIMSLIAVSILDASGLMKCYANKLKKLKPYFLTLLVILVGILSNFIGDYVYVLLVPFIGSLYKCMGRNSLLGILTMFLSISIGYGSGVLLNYNAYVMGGITELVATTQVDKNYIFKTLSNLYIMIASTGIISIIMSSVITKNLAPKLPVVLIDNDEEVNVSRKAFVISGIIFIILMAIIAYMIIPGLPMSGILLDNTQTSYIAKLFSPAAPFRDGLLFLIVVMMMIYGGVYGKLSKNIENLMDYNVYLSKSFQGIGYLFVIMFFASMMIGILNWTNLSEVIVTNIISGLSLLPLSGLPLIVLFFFAVIIMTLFMPGTTAKWQLVAPLMVPLFMRANITPDFIQFIFSVADGIGKAITPIFIYFIIMIGFLQKYCEGEKGVTVFGTLKNMMPTVLIMIGVWLLLILIWYLVGIPLGIGSIATL